MKTPLTVQSAVDIMKTPLKVQSAVDIMKTPLKVQSAVDIMKTPLNWLENLTNIYIYIVYECKLWKYIMYIYIYMDEYSTPFYSQIKNMSN